MVIERYGSAWISMIVVPMRRAAAVLRPFALALVCLVTGVCQPHAQDALFESRQLTPGEYTKGIEGPAVGPDGNLYVVNFQESGTIGRLKPGAGQSELFAKLPLGSIGNGIRFDRDGRMYVADYKLHNVLVFEPGQTVAQVYFHSDQLNQPNDLAIARDGTLYLSDPNFRAGTGQIWRVTRGPDGKGIGEVLASEKKLGLTNGIDLSPDGKTLYVAQSGTRELWAYTPSGPALTEPRLIKKFDGFDVDGLRTDIDGNIFVTRIGNGTVAVIAPDGELVREIATIGKNPSNLTFGGAGGTTVFVTQVDGGFVESFRVSRPGREHCFNAPAEGC
jgi:sugar lactone lactonase YvrE